jgi:hypothetical protein
MNKCIQCLKYYDNIEEHTLSCESGFILKEYENLIPCEICSTLINFDDYNDHMNNCNNPLSTLFGNILNLSPDIIFISNPNNLVNQNENNYQLDFINNFLNNININDNDNYEELNNISENIGNVEIGIKDISKISEKINENITCPICTIDYDSCIVTKCNHKFCEDCINKWLETNIKCPYCFVELNEN